VPAGRSLPQTTGMRTGPLFSPGFLAKRRRRAGIRRFANSARPRVPQLYSTVRVLHSTRTLQYVEEPDGARRRKHARIPHRRRKLVRDAG